jgi:hypothetical protein
MSIPIQTTRLVPHRNSKGTTSDVHDGWVSDERHR